jgi:hypothetical protein
MARADEFTRVYDIGATGGTGEAGDLFISCMKIT